MLHCRIPPKASLVLSLLILLGVGYIFEEQADASSDNCTLKSVKGEFGATFTGAITAGPFAGPYAAVARIVCDGKGACHGEGTQSLNGLIVPLVDLGATYTVNPDCTGTTTSEISPIGLTTHGFFVIADNGNEIHMVVTSPNTVINCFFRKLYPGRVI